MSQSLSASGSRHYQYSWGVLAGALTLVWLFVYYDTLKHMVSVWSYSETYKHCFLVPLISAYLIYEKRHQLTFAVIRPTAWLFAPILAVQVFFVVAEQLAINLFMHGAAVATFILFVWALIGTSAARIIAFPLGYLLFAVPFGEELVPWLQEVTANLSVGLLDVLNIPVYREGLYIYLPNGAFHVAEACAGVRFLIGTFTIGVLFAHLNYSKYWKQFTFIAVCAVLPVIANGFRAFGIMVIGYYSDMKYATGADHLVYGWFFFAFILILLFYLGSFGADKKPPGTAPAAVIKARSSVWSAGLLLLGALAAPQIMSGWVFSFDVKTGTGQPFERFASHPEITPIAAPKWAAPTTDEVYYGEWQGVAFRAIYVNEAQQDQELVSFRHRVFDNETWTQAEIGTTTIDGAPVKVVNIVNVVGEKRTLLAWYQVPNLQSIKGLDIKWQQLMNRINGHPNDGFFIVLATKDMQQAQRFMSAITGTSG
ncbi:exosortase A [Alteromonas gilva]|uniref:Exosortase n=1 Tax=Alteromonas gilva TaxID=2987522 RepID=A0ABT5KZX5_9ALTE|nr:exosortase A [Alteromonas gilva]MDC8830324.1 exosortase [Alteromonas gilva]